jgi:tRNA-splicing ligase RtcB
MPVARAIPPEESGARVPVLIWARAAPIEAIEQLVRVAALHFVVGHVAGMPDLHLASGVAVGTVFATDGVLVPSALGGDLGCGVAAVQLDLPARALGRGALVRILEGWGRAIPVGEAVQRGRGAGVPEHLAAARLSTGALERARERLLPRHLGTLGGGNHFVELDRDSGGGLWLLVHTGSRGLGGAVGAHHCKSAAARAPGPLPGLRVDEQAGRDCLADHAFALQFAAANRAAVQEAALRVVADLMGCAPQEEGRVELHHNFVAEEEHFGRKLWVHRKGAIAAPAGARALIPGSMGTASYLVEGMGSAASLGSASHGAGRVLTRSEARRQIPAAKLGHAMRRVVYDQRRERDLVEEAPAAYREIAEVLADEVDLVRPLTRLEPLVVLKG